VFVAELKACIKITDTLEKGGYFFENLSAICIIKVISDVTKDMAMNIIRIVSYADMASPPLYRDLRQPPFYVIVLLSNITQFDMVCKGF